MAVYGVTAFAPGGASWPPYRRMRPIATARSSAVTLRQTRVDAGGDVRNSLERRPDAGENRPPSPVTTRLSCLGAAMTARTPADGPHPAAVRPPDAFSSLIQVDVSALSHTGHRRANNEDHFLVARLGRSLDTLTTSLSVDDVPEHTEEVNYVMVV